MDKTLNLNYTVKPIRFEKINDEFTKLRCYIMATGKNRNFSYISEDVVNNAIPTLFNIPIVAHMKFKDDGTPYIGSHDRQIVIDDDSVELVDMTVPYGVVPESANPEFIQITEKDGTIANYLVADIILWTGRYPILDAKSETDLDIYFNQSMEITINSWKPLDEDKNYCEITDFTFSALCLLGKDSENLEYNSEPCFPSSCVKEGQYSLTDDFKNEFSLMMSELKKLNLNFKNNKIFFKENIKEEEILDKEKIKVLEKYNLTVDKLDFNIDDLSIEDLDFKLKEFSETNKENKKTSFSATYNQKRDALRNAVDAIIVKDSDGNVVESTFFYVMDFNDEYVYVEKDYWNESGDFEETHGRFTYTFDESTVTATITSELEEMFLIWLTAEEKASLDTERNNYSVLQTEFDNYKKTYRTDESEVNKLRTFKTKKLEDERKEAEKQVFAMPEFEKICNNDEFKLLRNKAKDYSIKELTDKCYAILGRANVKFSLSNSQFKSNIRIPIDINDSNNEPYGGLLNKYKK